jgi:hypothetical protein
VISLALLHPGEGFLLSSIQGWHNCRMTALPRSIDAQALLARAELSIK